MLSLRSMLRQAFHGGRQKVAYKDAPASDRPAAGIRLLALMCSKVHEDALKAIAGQQGWSYTRAATWSEGISAVEAGAAEVVIMDRLHLRADWLDILAFLLAPEHHCCVVLINTVAGGHRLVDEFLASGGHAYLQPPLDPPDVVRVVQDAADCWKKIDRAYGD